MTSTTFKIGDRFYNPVTDRFGVITEHSHESGHLFGEYEDTPGTLGYDLSSLPIELAPLKLHHQFNLVGERRLKPSIWYVQRVRGRGRVIQHGIQQYGNYASNLQNPIWMWRGHVHANQGYKKGTYTGTCYTSDFHMEGRFKTIDQAIEFMIARAEEYLDA